MKSLCGGLMMTAVVMALLAGHLVLSPLCCVIVIRCLHRWCAVWARVAVLWLSLQLTVSQWGSLLTRSFLSSQYCHELE